MVLFIHNLKSLIKKTLHCTILFIAFSLQAIAQPIKKTATPKPYKSGTKEFVISYALVVKGDKIDGIAETYNGGLKTAFIKGDVARLRLVSLMRTQSIFFNNKKGQSKKIGTIIKESGKVRTKMILNAKQWKQFNIKTNNTEIQLIKDDTLRILHLLCNKAIITNKDSLKLEVYYFPSAKNKTLAAAEPLFSAVPGLVMKYSFTKGAKTMEYTATTLKTGLIAAVSFIIPSKNYIIQKYKPSGISVVSEMAEEEEDEEGTEEEEMETPTSGTIPATTIDSTTNKLPTTNMPTTKPVEAKPPTKN